MLKWCIVGCGDVVQRLVQDSLQISGSSKVECILTDNIIEAKKFAKKYKINKVYKNTKKNINLIMKSDVNSVYIATPPNRHFYYIKIFSKKILNIVCEKPLVIKKNEIIGLTKLIRNKKINLFTCFYRRYLEKFIYIKKIIKKNFMGDILYFNTKYFHNEKNHPTAQIIKGKKIPWRFVKEISGGGNLFDMGVHAIDLIDFFLGKIDLVDSFKHNYKGLYNVEDMLIANFKLKNNIIGQASWCSVSSKKVDEFNIYGSKASIHFSMNISESDNITMYKNGKKVLKRIKMKQPLHKNMMKKFIKDLLFLNKNKKFHVMKNGFKTSEILNKISNN